MKSTWAGLISLLLPGSVLADGAATANPAVSGGANTNQYSLFNPKPAAQMRELNPDRPDKTDSPYTLDAGHLELEMDFANYTYDRSDRTTTKAWNVAPLAIRVGLLDKLEIQFLYDDYLNVRTESGSGKTLASQSGFGDLTTRLKINLWGDDNGKTAFGLIPFLKFPTSTDDLGNNAVEGGIGLPLALNLPEDFDLCVEPAFSCLRDASGSNDHADIILSASLGHAIIGKLSSYLEFFSDNSLENHAGWVATVDTGLEYLVTENIQLDCGCNFGVTPAADDYNPFAGISVRF